MKRFAIFALMFVVPISVEAEDKDAKPLAQDVLDKGAWPCSTPRRDGDGRDLHRGRPAPLDR